MTRWFYLSILLTLAALGVSLAVLFIPELYARLPEQVPTHWGISGEPDAWTPKENIATTFLLVPGVMVGLLLLTRVLPWLSPRKFDLDRFRYTYEYIMFLIVAMTAYIHGTILLASLSPSFDVSRLMLGGMCLFFALMGNVLGKVQRNFYVGIRTPWTLASETVWIATHRLAAWMFVVCGLLGFVLIALGISFIAAFVLIMVAALVPVVYSLILYKRLEKQGKLGANTDSNQEVPA